MDEKRKSKKIDIEVVDKKNRLSSNDNGKNNEKKASKRRDKSIGNNSLTAEEIALLKSANKEVSFHGNIYILNEKQSMYNLIY